MVSILLAFVTGLTTGGLSCLAVQGGLLASSLADQIEKDLSKTGRAQTQPRRQPQLALPIVAFLAAKLLAYTLLGFLLGLVGQMFQLTPQARAVFLIAVGIFMLGSALRMLNVHPIFRYFAFEPPAFLRRKLRKTASTAGSSLSTPIFLGLMTVLIPCGITQAMMAVALSAANPLQGAALMFAFTLGTSPVFFAVAYFATRLGSKLEKNFMRFVAVVVLVLGLITIDSGLTLAGSPYSLTRLLNGAPSQASAVTPVQGMQALEPSAAGPAPQEPAAPAGAAEENVITVNVMNHGYEPETVHARAGVPVKLRLVSDGVYSCSLAVIIPALRVERYLNSTDEAWVEIPAQEKGTVMPYSCSMGMYSGNIVFDL